MLFRIVFRETHKAQDLLGVVFLNSRQHSLDGQVEVVEEEGAVVVHDGLGLEVGEAVAHMGRRNGVSAGDFTNEMGDERGKNTIVRRLEITQANL